MNKPLSAFLSLLVATSALCAAEPAPIFEESFADSTLKPVWKVSGDRSRAVLDGGQIALTAEVDKENNLTQIVYTDSSLWFLQPDAIIRARVEVSVAPETKDAVARVMFSSVPGQAIKGNAIVLLVNGLNGVRAQVIREGARAEKPTPWKPLGGKVVRVELEVGPANYTARFWTEGSDAPEELTGEHGLDPATWGVPDRASLALGAWTSGGAAPTTVTFDNLQIFASH